MTFVTLLGLAAGTLTTASFLPQIVHTYRRKSAADISWGLLFVLGTGIFLWLAYGILLGEIPIIVANAVTFHLLVLLCLLKYRYDHSSAFTFSRNAS